MDFTSPSSGEGSALIKETTTQEFGQDVIEASMEQPVLVDFWAPWCGPCKQLTPTIEAAVTKAGGRVKLVKMNIDEHPAIPGQMGVQSIPTVVAFKDGRPADAFQGALPESEVTNFIDKIAGPAGPSPIDEMLEQANALLAEKQYQEAAQIFSAIAGQEQGNIDALVGLGTCALGLENLEQAQQILEMIPEDAANDPGVLSLKAQIELTSQAGDSSEIAPLKAKIEANPDDHQARFDLALALNGSGNRDEAADALLEIMRRDRSWNEDGARTELLKFFEAWGPMDDATKAARRKLSSLIFS